MGKGFHAGEEYERPKIYEIDQIAKFQMWLALEVIEQGEFPDSQEVYKVMRMFFAHLLTWDRELQAPLREQIAREIEVSKEAYIHEDVIRTPDGRWPGLKVIAVEDAATIARGK